MWKNDGPTQRIRQQNKDRHATHEVNQNIHRMETIPLYKNKTIPYANLYDEYMSPSFNYKSCLELYIKITRCISIERGTERKKSVSNSSDKSILLYPLHTSCSPYAIQFSLYILRQSLSRAAACHNPQDSNQAAAMMPCEVCMQPWREGMPGAITSPQRKPSSHSAHSCRSDWPSGTGRKKNL